MRNVLLKCVWPTHACAHVDGRGASVAHVCMLPSPTPVENICCRSFARKLLVSSMMSARRCIGSMEGASIPSASSSIRTSEAA